MKIKKAKNQNLLLGIIGLIVAIIILFIVGLYVYKPETTLIQGEAEATEVRVSGKIPGRIQEFARQEGESVKLGDTLVVIHSPELTAKLEQAAAAENAAIAIEKKTRKGARQETINGAYDMWQKAKVGTDIAKKSFDRVQRLFQKGVVAIQKRDEAEAQYLSAQATENAAKSQYEMAVNGAENEDKMAASANVERARGAVQEVKSYITETILLSPIDGEISEVFPKCGELVGTGAPIMTIVDLNNMWFSFNIREDLLKNIKMGSTFNIKIPALDNKTVAVKVTFIKALASYATWKATKATDQFDSKTFEVRAKPITPIADLRPGMSAIIIDKID